MKTTIFAFLVLSILSCSSCVKCFTCKDNTTKFKYCFKDKDKQEDIDLFIKNYEAEGYKCTASSEAF